MAYVCKPENFEIEDGVLIRYYGSDKEIIIPDGVTSIDDMAFWHKKGLISVIIPDGVTSIGYSAFERCTRLTSIIIPDSVTSIGYKAFDSCTRLTSINIPDSVTNIGKYSFSACARLITINVSENNMNFCSRDGVLYNKNMTELIKYPEGKKENSFSVPDSVTSIGDGAFERCSRLTSIHIPNSVTDIGNWTFYRCTSLTSINISDGVTSIGNRAFYYCTSLKSIHIPNSVTHIGNGAFYGCISLTELTLPVNQYKVTINVAEIEEAEESVENALDMLRAKDFSRKLSTKVKYKLIMDYFFCTGDEDAKAYIKKNFSKIMKRLIDNGDEVRVEKILEKTDFVTKRNIDKYVTYSADSGQNKIHNILVNCKSKNPM